VLSRELVRLDEAEVSRRAVSGDLALADDELVIQLRPASGPVPAGREPHTVTTRPIHQPQPVTAEIYRPGVRWDREAVTALIMLILVTTLLVAAWVVIP